MQDIEQLTRMIADKMPSAAKAEQVAEECVQLAHAFMKLARVIRGESPTTATVQQVKGQILEEVNDLINALSVFGVHNAWMCEKPRLRMGKMRRWADRLENNAVCDCYTKDGRCMGTKEIDIVNCCGVKKNCIYGRE